MARAKRKHMDPAFYSSKMTLKPTKKRQRKNKTTQLQVLYDQGKVTSTEFYMELTKFIKSRLMIDLIRRGYYIDGKRQNSYTRDECDSCYTHVLHKVLTGYSPEKGTIATYIRWQIRGWGQLVIQKQQRKYKWNPKGTVSLDNTNIYNIRLEDYENNCQCPEDLEDLLDVDSFRSSLLDSLTKDDIADIRKGIEVFKYYTPNFEWLQEKQKGKEE